MKKNETTASKINISMSFQENDKVKDVNKSTDIISSLIHEYLLKREYNKTLESFQEEMSFKLKQKNYYKMSFLNITESGLMKYFGLGRKTGIVRRVLNYLKGYILTYNSLRSHKSILMKKWLKKK